MVVTGGSAQRSTRAHSPPGVDVAMELRHAGLTWHVMGDEIVILDLEESTYLKLNGTARLLWECLTTPTTEAELTTTLVTRFGIAEERAAGDVSAFLAHLRQRDLLAG